MKPFREELQYPVDDSFIIKYDDFPHFTVPYHSHNEYEIVYIIKSFGKKYVGDVIEAFRPGDLSFYGHNLSHFYLNDERFYKNDPDYRVNAIVVLFPSDFITSAQLQQSEFKNICKLLNNSNRGLKFAEAVTSRAGLMLHKILKKTGIDRYIHLLKLLDYLGSSESYPIASLGYVSAVEDSVAHRMEKINRFCRNNYTKRLSLKDISSIAVMHPASFSRYFHQNKQKTFTRYINELRISQSCELLKKSNQTITYISMKSGFRNLSHFNRTFRKIIGKTPSEYRKFFINVH